MSIWNQYNEFSYNLKKEVKEMVKAIYVKTYGKKPNFAEGEIYILDMNDIPYKRDCKIYVDIYNTIDESVITEKQKIQCIHIDNDGDIEFETESGSASCVSLVEMCMVNIGCLMNIYSFLRLVMGEIGINADSRIVYVKWDVNDSEYETFVRENIPTEVEIPFYVTDEEVEDYLSDKYGYCVESYTIDNE
jgi:hypothetical protein